MLMFSIKNRSNDTFRRGMWQQKISNAPLYDTFMRENEFRVLYRENAALLRRLLTYTYIYFDTSVRCSKLPGCTDRVNAVSRVMSDLAPTGAYFLLRCLNIILTMFLWPRADTRAVSREIRNFARPRKVIVCLAASIRSNCVVAKNSRASAEHRSIFTLAFCDCTRVWYMRRIFFFFSYTLVAFDFKNVRCCLVKSKHY